MTKLIFDFQAPVDGKAEAGYPSKDKKDEVLAPKKKDITASKKDDIKEDFKEDKKRDSLTDLFVRALRKQLASEKLEKTSLYLRTDTLNRFREKAKKENIKASVLIRAGVDALALILDEIDLSEFIN